MGAPPIAIPPEETSPGTDASSAMPPEGASPHIGASLAMPSEEASPGVGAPMAMPSSEHSLTMYLRSKKSMDGKGVIRVPVKRW